MSWEMVDAKQTRYLVKSAEEIVYIGIYKPDADLFIPMEDILAIAEYAVTNTDLIGTADPRLDFVNRISRMKIRPGYNAGNMRLGPAPEGGKE